jgi:hypothetical protein
MVSLSFEKLFKSIDPTQFDNLFDSDEKALAFLAEEKWKEGFVCRFCGNDNYCKGKSVFSRRCTRCKKEESVTAHTMFHRCKIPLTDAMKIAYMVCHRPGISTYEISREMETRQMTCWKFKKKIMECIESKGKITDSVS